MLTGTCVVFKLSGETVPCSLVMARPSSSETKPCWCYFSFLLNSRLDGRRPHLALIKTSQLVARAGPPKASFFVQGLERRPEVPARSWASVAGTGRARQGQLLKPYSKWRLLYTKRLLISQCAYLFDWRTDGFSFSQFKVYFAYCAKLSE